MKMKYKSLTFVFCLGLLVTGCAVESHKVVQTHKIQTAAQNVKNIKLPISIGTFNNSSNFLKGVFSTGEDRLSSQAKTILTANLKDSGYFSVLDRSNLSVITQENKFSNTKSKIKAANYIVTGDVVEFGRKDVGDKQLWGILGKGKSQIAYSKVTLNIINVDTSEVIYSANGAGEYSLSSREVIGFGSSSGYDTTLNGKVLSLAIQEAVTNLTMEIENAAQ
ncbi:CsgG/HfaB family protein [Campylobacter hyointestinalis]